MAERIVSFIIENDVEFQRALDLLEKNVSDFRIPFNLIANHWRQGNKKIFLNETQISIHLDAITNSSLIPN